MSCFSVSHTAAKHSVILASSKLRLIINYCVERKKEILETRDEEERVREEKRNKERERERQRRGERGESEI